MDIKNKSEQLYNDNIGLVHSVALRFKNKAEFTCNYDDVLQEGFKGLWLASIKYDESKGHKFTTYAYTVIWGYISNYINRFIDNKKREYYEKPVLYSLNVKIPGLKNDDDLEYIDTIESDYKEVDDNEYDLLIDQTLKLAYKYRWDIDMIYDIIRLRIKGKTQAEIANILYTSQMTVGRRLKAFKEVVKRELLV